jgi:hypothetical protein
MFAQKPGEFYVLLATGVGVGLAPRPQAASASCTALMPPHWHILRLFSSQYQIINKEFQKK